ncbi:hypothetical protein AeRB84_012765 [Aphanomyces euteiches]|nr:hypothetical protein AeRB84_012765 [Aphanomyces euteiches]
MIGSALEFCAMKRQQQSDSPTSRQKKARTCLVFDLPTLKELESKSKTYVSQPKQLSGFSKYSDGKVQFDRSLLKRLHKGAPLGSDLLEGLDEYKEPPNNAPIEHLIDAMAPQNRAQHDSEAPTEPNRMFHIVTYRNNLNKIMGTPYNTNNPFSFFVQRIENTLYLDVHLTEDSSQGNIYQKQGAYAGRRYEVLSSEDNTDSVGGEYCGVFSMMLGTKRLLIGAELDGCADDGKYIELKTFRLLKTPKDKFSFERYKLLAFWIQSYIVGVPLIRVGFRDDKFKLTKEQTFSTTELPRFASSYWKSSVCLNFADSFLDWLIAQDIHDNTVYLVNFDPRGKKITMSSTSKAQFVTKPINL